MSKRVVNGTAIKAIRQIRALTEPQLYASGPFAARCFISTAHLSNVEAGRRNLPDDVIHRIAAHLGVPVDAISHTTKTEEAA